MAQPIPTSFTNLENLLEDLSLGNGEPTPPPFNLANGALNDLADWVGNPGCRHHNRYDQVFQGPPSSYLEQFRSYLTPGAYDLLKNVTSLTDLAAFDA
jgi:hypothetical protein